jgi:hypothetical protein
MRFADDCRALRVADGGIFKRLTELRSGREEIGKDHHDGL